MCCSFWINLKGPLVSHNALRDLHASSQRDNTSVSTQDTRGRLPILIAVSTPGVYLYVNVQYGDGVSATLDT